MSEQPLDYVFLAAARMRQHIAKARWAAWRARNEYYLAKAEVALEAARESLDRASGYRSG